MRVQRYIGLMVVGVLAITLIQCYLGSDKHVLFLAMGKAQPTEPLNTQRAANTPSALGKPQPIEPLAERAVTTTTSSPAKVLTREQMLKKAAIDCTTCNIYDLDKVVDSSLRCVPLKSNPKTTICVYPPEKDVYISKSIISYGGWEGDQLAKVQAYLTRHPGMGMIDVGCNIGVYTIPIAQMGRQVVAVEPNHDHVIRVHKAARLEKLVSRITLLNNAVGDIRGQAKLKMHPNNQGAIEVHQIEGINNTSSDALTVKTITMDDLLPFCEFSEAILKIDIEGFEHKAFAKAERLFANIYIPIVLMEWAAMSPFHKKPTDDPDRIMVEKMVDFFTKRNFIATSWQKAELSPREWETWPRDIIWISKDSFL